MFHRRMRRRSGLCRRSWRRPYPIAGGAAGWLSLLLAACMLVTFLSWISRQVRPILKAMAVTQISNAVTSTVNEAISAGIVDHHITYEDMVEVETDQSGRVTVLKSNMTQANLLRAELLRMVLDKVSELEERDFSIPFGSLTDIDLMFGRGPDVTIKVLSMGAVNGTFRHEFTAAGVNQTLHQIMLAVDVQVQILLPGETVDLTVPTQVCVAETVIVGEVPGTYLQLENGGT